MQPKVTTWSRLRAGGVELVALCMVVFALGLFTAAWLSTIIVDWVAMAYFALAIALIAVGLCALPCAFPAPASDEDHASSIERSR